MDERILHKHTPHSKEYEPKDWENDRKERMHQGNAYQRFKMRVATVGYNILGSMEFFYICIFISLSGFPGIPGINCTPQAFVQWISGQTIQLWALPLLGAVAIATGAVQEHLAREHFKATMRSLHNDQEMIKHLNAQDGKILDVVDQVLDIAVHQEEQGKEMMKMQEAILLIQRAILKEVSEVNDN